MSEAGDAFGEVEDGFASDLAGSDDNLESVHEEEEEDGEDLMDNVLEDYRVMPHLDRYEDDGLDAEPDDYDEEAELEARLRAEAALDDRDDEERGGRIDPATGRVRPRALEVDEEDDVWHRQQR